MGIDIVHYKWRHRMTTREVAIWLLAMTVPGVIILLGKLLYGG